MNFLIGDVQGCCDALDRLLAEIGYSPSRDHFWLLGDLVNRGPQSLATLRRVKALEGAADCLLGNHDLHLIAVAAGAQRLRRQDTLTEVLDAPDSATLLDWLRRRRLAAFDDGWLLVHAGVAPQWDRLTTLALAAEVEGMLQSRDAGGFLHVMYGDKPARWSNKLDGAERLRFIVNALTRMRFCDKRGRLELETKAGADAAPRDYMPWFDVPGRLTEGTPVAFGHWSTLGLIDSPQLMSLDTGCVWGGALTAVRVDGGRRELVQVSCKPARGSGGAS